MALKFANNNSLSAITSTPSGVGGGSLNLISTQTASSSATISFTSGIDSTYKKYVFKFYDIHPATDNSSFTFQASTDGGSNYNTTVTSSSFRAYHDEPDGNNGLSYDTSRDQAQGTAFENIIGDIGNDNDQTGIGTLYLFNPSDTTFVKHFISRMSHEIHGYSRDVHSAGYFNTASALNAIQFKMSSGNMDTGTIKLYGVS